MLKACEKCGRPIYLPPGVGRVECSYCYEEQVGIRATSHALTPQELKWQVPLLAGAGWERKEDYIGQTPPDWELLTLLGEYHGLREQLLALYASQKEEREGFLAQAAMALEEGNALRVDVLARKYARLIPDGRLQEVHLRLLSFQEEIRREKKRGELAALREELLSREVSLERATEILSLLPAYSDFPEAQEARRLAEGRRQEAIKRREQYLAQQERKKRLRKRLRVPAILLVLFLLFSLRAYSKFVRQPNQLEKARAYAAQGEYERAEKIYASLKDREFLVNSETKEQARKELAAMCLIWGACLEEQGEWEKAIEAYRESKDREAEEAARERYARHLIEEGDYKTAAYQWEKVGNKEEAALAYAHLAAEFYQAGNYKEAAKYVEKTDEQKLLELGIQGEEVYLHLAQEADAAGEIASAIFYYEKAGDDRAVVERLEKLSVRRARDLAQEALLKAGFGEGGGEFPAKGTMEDFYEDLRKALRPVRRMNAWLAACEILDAAGISLVEVYPEGMLVENLAIPEGGRAVEGIAREGGKLDQAMGNALGEVDPTKPLVIFRKEHDHYVHFPPEYGTGRGIVDTYFLVGYWQALDEDRRASCFSECTCLLLGEELYERTSNALCDYSVVGPLGYSRCYAIYPTYRAVDTCKLVKGDGGEALVLGQWISFSRYDGLSGGPDLSYSSKSKSFTEVGLSGAFHTQWMEESLQEAYQAMLEGGKGGGNDGR